MTLRCTFTAGIGALDLDVDLTVGDEIVAVLGPNGAGKTTLLRAIAGLHPIDTGCITVDGTPLDQPTADVFVAPADRPVGMVFQDYLLFPFLSARRRASALPTPRLRSPNATFSRAERNGNSR